ncbi:hypothetical protein C2S51_020454 [Perilla frutescens var. frutescens]|nr:hypothetical protein C2S51_020454 [Perilla frutescens var. frutescens]
MDSLHGFVGPQICVMCQSSKESLDHLFWSCPLAMIVWRWIFSIFQLHEMEAASIHQAFVQFMGSNFSSQVLILWKSAVIHIIWCIWTFRNKASFEDMVPTSNILISLVRVALGELSYMCRNGGTMHNDVNDLVILKALKVKPRPAPPRSPIPVIWRPPPTGWIKINMDRSPQGAPGSLATD